VNGSYIQAYQQQRELLQNINRINSDNKKNPVVQDLIMKAGFKRSYSKQKHDDNLQE
jgi:hypothetical protein